MKRKRKYRMCKECKKRVYLDDPHHWVIQNTKLTEPNWLFCNKVCHDMFSNRRHKR